MESKQGLEKQNKAQNPTNYVSFDNLNEEKFDNQSKQDNNEDQADVGWHENIPVWHQNQSDVLNLDKQTNTTAKLNPNYAENVISSNNCESNISSGNKFHNHIRDVYTDEGKAGPRHPLIHHGSESTVKI